MHSSGTIPVLSSIKAFALDRVVIVGFACAGSPAPSNLEGAVTPRVLACAFLLADVKALFWSSVIWESSSSEFIGVGDPAFSGGACMVGSQKPVTWDSSSEVWFGTNLFVDPGSMIPKGFLSFPRPGFD
jgi:hypothetical protein